MFPIVIASLCLASSFAVPTMPEAEWDDTEVVTNAVLPTARADSRVWDTVRVVCRGMDFPSPSISGAIENTPLAIRIR